nr:YdiU family protein [uncultured Rhodococcus sp.]
MPERFFAKQEPARVPEAKLIRFNRELAAKLSIDADWLESADGVAMLAGNAIPEGAEPIAQAYAGHQFGGFSPQLGDGRAILLGEVIDVDGARRDLQLKGSGRTLFSRGGDGKSALGPVIREYIVSEAMAALGVPTTRALAAVTTGERVMRQEGPLLGAVFTRVAASHIRVGTFQYFWARNDIEALRLLADHAIARHYSDAAEAPDSYVALLESVAAAQADLIAQWMSLGFIHGVMNTDNTAISGETIDYGPCAFLDAFDPGAVFSSIDHRGRYAYGNQPAVLKWNLARFAETLLTLVAEKPDDAIGAVSAVLDTFVERYDAYFAAGIAAKLGSPGRPLDRTLVDELLTIMKEEGADWTGTFRALAEVLRGESADLGVIIPAGRIDPWLQRWRGSLEGDVRQIADEMDRVNPLYIPRNHRVDAALRSATDGDLEPFRELLEVVTHPFDRRDEWAEYAQPAPRVFSEGFQTFCGT